MHAWPGKGGEWGTEANLSLTRLGLTGRCILHDSDRIPAGQFVPPGSAAFGQVGQPSGLGKCAEWRGPDIPSYTYVRSCRVNASSDCG